MNGPCRRPTNVGSPFRSLPPAAVVVGRYDGDRAEMYDPPPRTLAEAFQRLWIVGLLAVILVDVLVIATGPGDISILRRFFIWFSTLAFSVWLLRDHRRRLRVRQRRLIFLVCSGSLILLVLILFFSAF